ncbi:MAG: cation:proton antiporter [Alphaproteobacteria bacterium]
MEAAHIDTLTSIALVTTAALLCGLVLIRLRQPAIVGYIVAGVVLGPTGFKLVSNTETVQVLAELGVIMLLFLIGMELSLRSFKSVYKTALSAAALQIIAALGVFYGIGHFMEWTLERVLVFAFATALSSTAVAIKILEETDELRTPVGRTTVSVLIAQDLAVIPMLLIISAFGTGHAAAHISSTETTLMILLKLAIAIGLLVIISWFLSKRDRITLPMSDWIVSRPEIIPLASMAFCFSWATLSGVIGLSTAYGAFLAGLIIGNSNVRATLHKASEPIQTILLMVFFLSIGLLIDLKFIAANWQNVLLVLSTVTLLKTTVNVAILHWLGEPWGRAFHSGVVMGQIGEFSFILCAVGLTAKVISVDDYRLMISVIALSLLISPMWLSIARRLHDLALKKLGAGILTQASPDEF